MPLESRILQNSHYIQEILIRVLENPQKTLCHHASRLLLNTRVLIHTVQLQYHAFIYVWAFWDWLCKRVLGNFTSPTLFIFIYSLLEYII